MDGHQAARMLKLAPVILLWVVGAVFHVEAQEGGTVQTTGFRVDSVELVYATESVHMPDSAVIGQTQILLLRQGDGYVGPEVGAVGSELITLNDVGGDDGGGEGWLLYGSAIAHMTKAVVAAINEAGLAGVTVLPDPKQIDEQGRDVRAGGDRSLRLVVRAAIVSEVQTHGAGDRIGEDEAMNHPLHQRIRDRSPIKPRGEGGGGGGWDTGEAEDTSNLLLKGELDEYIHLLNRHARRRVDASVAAAEEPGAFILKYLVQEQVPWTAYTQISNTGTAQTNEWREQFGFSHAQLTGNDDVLSLYYATAGFDASHAVGVSYDAPFFDADRTRFGVNGFYNEFVASDVGGLGLDFSGDTVGGEASLTHNFYQKSDLFVDLAVSAQFKQVGVDDEGSGTDTDEQFFLPTIGLNAQQFKRTGNLYATASFQWNVAEIAGTSVDAASMMGRADVDKNWTSFNWMIERSFFLEPLLNGDAWKDLSTPSSSTLAHEIAFWTFGQRVLDDDRVTPQSQSTLGGMHTVRGYRESAAVGDNSEYLSVEYRFHVPRAFAPEPEPGELFNRPFRWAPRTVYTHPDWDLVFKAFVDYGHTSINRPDRSLGDSDNTLLGAGVGIDFQVKRNLFLTVDWAQAMRDVNDVTEGSSQVHISATYTF